jgi:murein DD-endopeptidase MepM/ murein hydrolase activator NlpD
MSVSLNFGKILTLWAFMFHMGMSGQSESPYAMGMDSLFPIAFPLKATDFIKVSSDYGYRVHPIEDKWMLHEGIDLVAPKGRPIYATASGIATKVAYGDGYGNHIVISHWKDIKTLYGHLWFCLVQRGDSVQQGQLIGFVGETGRATAPHLHYELWFGNKKLSPLVLWRHYMKRKLNLNTTYRG